MIRQSRRTWLPQGSPRGKGMDLLTGGGKTGDDPCDRVDRPPGPARGRGSAVGVWRTLMAGGPRKGRRGVTGVPGIR